MEKGQVILISDLLRRRRPISGTSSLLTSQPHAAAPSAEGDAKTLNPNASSGTKVLKSLSEPSVVIGTISLPKLGDSLSSGMNSCQRCLSFSDSSASACCDVLDFDFRMIGRKIRVVSWNFIPSKMCRGLVEIIKWEFAEDSISSVDSFPLYSGGVNEDCRKVRHNICGLLESVSPVSLIPCTMGTNGNEENLHGFIAEVSSCDCGLCKGKDCKKMDSLVEGHGGHAFSQTNFVYFNGAASCWHPAMSRLIGNLVSLWGLRKKIVYVRKEEAQLMFVTSNVTCLNYRKLHNKDVSHRCGKTNLEGNGELGMYVGVVRGVYMQSMIFELDEEVWLLLTDQSLVVPHSLRVGAVLLLRNVHIVNPRFSWRKMLILGACHRTSISTVSFSPLETGCHLPIQSQSRLGNFIKSLVLPAGLWVLLVVQCFRKKFSRTFSEREILGSKHKEGLVEAYARFRLPLSVFLPQQSMFVGFCKHDFCGADTNISFGSLSLAVPFSNFVNNCDRMWVKSLLQMESGLKILDDCSQVNHFFEQNRLLDQPIRKILPSKDIGVSLLGNLKISPASGRLQYMDVTGGIDAVIPDLPSAWNMDAIYEVTEYNLVLEGMPEMRGQTWMLEDDLFSCTSIFRSVELERQMKLVVYVHFAWSDVICRDFPIHHSLSCSANPEPGIFHLLHLVHKFPVQPQFHGDLIIPGKCFSFAEATVLPWDLNVATIDGAALPVSIPQHELDKNCHSDFAFKRCKTNHSSICSKKVELGSNLNHGNMSCNHSSNFITLPHKRNAHNGSAFPAQISCAVVVQRLHGQRMTLPGIFFSQDDRNRVTMPLESLKKLVLEFDSENLFKYKFLRIGGYYIMKHSSEKCFCESMDKSLASQVVVNLDTHLYSLSFHFDEIALHSSLYDQSLDSCSISESSYRCRCYLRNELLFHPCSTAGHGISSDISLHVMSDATSLLDLDIQALKEAVIKLSMRPADVYRTCQSAGCANSLVNLIQDQGTHSWNHLPQGDLVSLEGTVVSLHSGCCAVDKLTCHASVHDVHQLRFAQGWKNLICLRVLTHCRMVEISGCLYKHNYPIGLGPGADVTFHRVLASSEQGHLLLMPVSFITVNSVKEVVSPVANSFSSVGKGNVPSLLISDLIRCDECKPIRFCCRIVAVQIVMLERNSNLDKLLSDIHPRKVITNIPLAGFILDDGSSQCCCWANGERAVTFLRLHEELPLVGFGSCWWRLPGVGADKACSTPSSYLDKILKRHGRVTLKNYASVYETSCQDLQLSVSSEFMFGTQDENILRFIVLNACSSTYWSVIGHVMDSNAISELGKYLMEEQMNMPALPNLWAREVCPVDILTEARSLYQDL